MSKKFRKEKVDKIFDTVFDEPFGEKRKKISQEKEDKEISKRLKKFEKLDGN